MCIQSWYKIIFHSHEKLVELQLVHKDKAAKDEETTKN